MIIIIPDTGMAAVIMQVGTEFVENFGVAFKAQAKYKAK